MRYKFDERLKKTMEDRFISQKQLADALGLSTRQSISNYWAGTNKPNTELLYHISIELGVSSDYLLGISDNPSTEPNLQITQKTTGLSPDAIEALYMLNKLKDLPIFKKKIMDVFNIINIMLEDLHVVFDEALSNSDNEIASDLFLGYEAEAAINNSPLSILYSWYDYLNNNDKAPHITVGGKKLSSEESKEIFKVSMFSQLSNALNDVLARERGEL